MEVLAGKEIDVSEAFGLIHFSDLEKRELRFSAAFLLLAF